MPKDKKKQFQTGDEVFKTFIEGYERPLEPQEVRDPDGNLLGHEVAQVILRDLQQRLASAKVG